MRTASADISAKIVLPTPSRRAGLRAGCDHSPPEPNRFAHSRHNGPHGAHTGDGDGARASARSRSGPASRMLVGGLAGPRLRRLAVLGQQLGLASASSASVTGSLQQAVGPGRPRRAAAAVRPEGQGLGADPDPEVREDVRRAGARGHQRRACSDARASATSPGPPTRARSATTRWPRTGSPTASRCAGCRSCGPVTGDRRDRRTTFTYRLDTDPNEAGDPVHRGLGARPGPEEPRRGGPQPAQRPGQRLITLTTCSEMFHTDNRMIAFGHLVRATPKGPIASRHGRPTPRPMLVPTPTSPATSTPAAG